MQSSRRMRNKSECETSSGEYYCVPKTSNIIERRTYKKNDLSEEHTSSSKKGIRSFTCRNFQISPDRLPPRKRALHHSSYVRKKHRSDSPKIFPSASKRMESDMSLSDSESSSLKNKKQKRRKKSTVATGTVETKYCDSTTDLHNRLKVNLRKEFSPEPKISTSGISSLECAASSSRLNNFDLANSSYNLKQQISSKISPVGRLKTFYINPFAVNLKSRTRAIPHKKIEQTNKSASVAISDGMEEGMILSGQKRDVDCVEPHSKISLWKVDFKNALNDDYDSFNDDDCERLQILINKRKREYELKLRENFQTMIKNMRNNSYNVQNATVSNSIYCNNRSNEADDDSDECVFITEIINKNNGEEVPVANGNTSNNVASRDSIDEMNGQVYELFDGVKITLPTEAVELKSNSTSGDDERLRTVENVPKVETSKAHSTKSSCDKKTNELNTSTKVNGVTNCDDSKTKEVDTSTQENSVTNCDDSPLDFFSFENKHLRDKLSTKCESPITKETNECNLLGKCISNKADKTYNCEIVEFIDNNSSVSSKVSAKSNTVNLLEQLKSGENSEKFEINKIIEFTDETKVSSETKLVEKRSPDCSAIPSSPETSRKNEFYSYLKINTKPLSQKDSAQVIQNRRSARVRYIELLKQRNDSIDSQKVTSNSAQKKSYLNKGKLIKKNGSDAKSDGCKEMQKNNVLLEDNKNSKAGRKKTLLYKTQDKNHNKKVKVQSNILNNLKGLRQKKVNMIRKKFLRDRNVKKDLMIPKNLICNDTFLSNETLMRHYSGLKTRKSFVTNRSGLRKKVVTNCNVKRNIKTKDKLKRSQPLKKTEERNSSCDDNEAAASSYIVPTTSTDIAEKINLFNKQKTALQQRLSLKDIDRDSVLKVECKGFQFTDIFFALIRKKILDEILEELEISIPANTVSWPPIRKPAVNLEDFVPMPGDFRGFSQYDQKLAVYSTERVTISEEYLISVYEDIESSRRKSEATKRKNWDVFESNKKVDGEATDLPEMEIKDENVRGFEDKRTETVTSTLKSTETINNLPESTLDLKIDLQASSSSGKSEMYKTKHNILKFPQKLKIKVNQNNVSQAPNSGLEDETQNAIAKSKDSENKLLESESKASSEIETMDTDKFKPSRKLKIKETRNKFPEKQFLGPTTRHIVAIDKTLTRSSRVKLPKLNLEALLQRVKRKRDPKPNANKSNRARSASVNDRDIEWKDDEVKSKKNSRVTRSTSKNILEDVDKPQIIDSVANSKEHADNTSEFKITHCHSECSSYSSSSDCESYSSAIESHCKPVLKRRLSLPCYLEPKCLDYSNPPYECSADTAVIKTNSAFLEKTDDDSQPIVTSDANAAPSSLLFDTDTIVPEASPPPFIPLVTNNSTKKTFQRVLLKKSCSKPKVTSPCLFGSQTDFSELKCFESEPMQFIEKNSMPIVRQPILERLQLRQQKNVAPIQRKSGQHEIDISEIDGSVLDIHFVDNILVVVQEYLISFWKQSPLGTMLGAQNMWIGLGKIQRLKLEKGCMNKKAKSQMVMNLDNATAYVELWTKEHKSEKRECPISDVFATVYFFCSKGGLNKKVIQLENIKGSEHDVQYMVLQNSRSVLISWRNQFSTPPCTLLRKYTLATDFQTVSSVSEIESVTHYVTSLKNVSECTEMIIGLGDQHVSVWNLSYGRLVTTVDIGNSNGSQMSLAGALEMNCVWALCDRGFLFILQLTENGSLRLIAINGLYNACKPLQTYKVPEEFNELRGVSVEAGVLTACYTNGVLCWALQSGTLLLQCPSGPYVSLFHSRTHVASVDQNYNISLKHITAYLLED